MTICPQAIQAARAAVQRSDQRQGGPDELPALREAVRALLDAVEALAEQEAHSRRNPR